MPKNKNKNVIPILTVPRNATRRQIYAKLRREFTAADLQKFTEIGPTVSAEQLQAELEAIHRAETKKRRRIQKSRRLTRAAPTTSAQM